MLAHPGRDQPADPIGEQKRQEHRDRDLGPLGIERLHRQFGVDDAHHEQLLLARLLARLLQRRRRRLIPLARELLAHLQILIRAQPGRDVPGSAGELRAFGRDLARQRGDPRPHGHQLGAARRERGGHGILLSARFDEAGLQLRHQPGAGLASRLRVEISLALPKHGHPALNHIDIVLRLGELPASHGDAAGVIALVERVDSLLADPQQLLNDGQRVRWTKAADAHRLDARLGVGLHIDLAIVIFGESFRCGLGRPKAGENIRLRPPEARDKVDA